MSESKRVIGNTIIIYTRMIISVGIGLYATRVILDSLGVSDYGIFNVIAGIIGVLSLLNTTMATSSQRHISFSLGTGDSHLVKKIFASSLFIHLILGITLIVFFEIIGIYLIRYKLQIESDRVFSAQILYHFIVISTFFTVLAVPYDAVVNAHENMIFLSATGILESVLKLAIAIYLYYTRFDKLLTYGFLLMAVTVFIRLIKGYYCKRNYAECSAKLSEYDKSSIKELFSFASWNLLGVLAFVLKNQGISVILNLFFTTVVNAAYGVAAQVNGQISIFSGAMIQSIEPQMIKSEGAGNRSRLIELGILASKYAFFLFTLFAFPLALELNWALSIWLKKIPDGTIVFCRLIIVLTAIIQLGIGITICAHAIGSIKKYQLYTVPIQLISLPLGYTILKLGYPSYSILIVYIGVEVATLIFSMIYFEKNTGSTFFRYIKEVILSCLTPLVLSAVCYWLIVIFLKVSFLSNGIPSAMFLFVIYLLFFYLIATKPAEREKIAAVFNSILKKNSVKIF